MFKKEGNISIGRLIVTLMLLLIVVVGGTYAWLTYSSRQSALVLTIGNINDTQIKLSPYQVEGTLTPSSTYSSGVESNVDVTTGDNNSTSYALFYKINNIDKALIDAGLSYTIKSNTSDNVVTKTFATRLSELGYSSDNIPSEIMILDSYADNELSAATATNYKVYLWLPSTSDQSEVQNSTLDVELNASIGSVTISGTNIYGETLTATVNDAVIDANATYTYQWYYNSSASTKGGTAIEGATSSTYTIGNSLAGKYIYVVVTVTNGITKGKMLSDVTDAVALQRTTTVTSGSTEIVYNGVSLTNGSCTATNLLSGHTVTCTNGGTLINVGTASNTINTVVIKDASGNDVTSQYNITKTAGTLKITTKSIAVTWGSTTTFTYNGTAQAPTVTTPVDGVNGEKLNLVRTTQTNVGSHTSTASCSSVDNGQKLCSNYTLTNATKTFTITKYTPTLSISATSGTVAANSTKTFTATTSTIAACSGVLKATSANTSYVTVNPTSTNITETTSTTLTYAGIAYTTGTNITVAYTPSDTTNCNSATSQTFTASVTTLTPTVSLEPKSATYTGSAISANTATATYGGNSISLSYTYTYYNGTSCSGTALSGAPTNVGNYSVKATSTETGVYASASSDCETHTITKYTPTLALSATSGSVAVNSTKTFTATPTTISACQGTLTATSTNTSYVTITGGASNSNVASGTAKTITYKGISYTTGTNITVAYTPSDTTNCNSAQSKTFTASVTTLTPTVNLEPKSATYTGSAISANTATATSGGSNISLSYTYTYYNGTSCSGTALSGAPTNVGNYSVKATSTETGVYASASSDCETHTITAKSIAVTWGDTTTFTYNGTAQAPTVTTPVDGVNSEKLNLVRTTQTSVGSHTSTASCSSVTGGQALCSNYTLTNATKAFTIESKTITVRFYRNNATSITPSGGSASTATYVDVTCQMSSSSGCSITSPTITAPSNTPTVLGWDTLSTSTSGSWAQNTSQTFTANATYYAITTKEAITLTAKFNANNATLSSTADKTCELAATYNGTAQATSCTVTAPTITAPTNTPTVVGFNTSASSTTNNSAYNTSTKVLTITTSTTGSTWYAITTKTAVTLTAKFNANNATLSSTSDLTCNTTATYNGASPDTNCTVTAPTITAPTNTPTVVGFNTSANSTTNNSAYNTSTKVLTITTSTTGSTWYAITTKAAITYTAKTQKNVSSATGTQTSASCTIAAVYNGATQDTSCSVTLPANPYTLTSWTFNGWVNAGSSTTTTTTSGTAANQTMSISGNVNIVATWKKTVSLTVTFDKNGGSANTTSAAVSATIYNGATSATATFTAPACTTRTGYTCLGYNTSSSATSASLAVGGTFSKAVTVAIGNTSASIASGYYHIWKVNTYTLTLTKGTGISTIYYKVNGASSYSSTTSSTTVSVNYGSTYYVYATASTGYTYTAYTSSSPLSGTMGTSGATYAPSATLNNYTVNYYNGSTKITSTTHNHGTALTTWSNLGATVTNSAYGWSFAGWSTANNNTTISYSDGASVTSNLTLYAVYKRTITFISGENSATTHSTKPTQYWNPFGTTSGTHYTSVSTPTATTISGFTFSGWTPDNTATSYSGTTIYPEPAKSNTIYAVYGRDATFYSGGHHASSDILESTQQTSETVGQIYTSSGYSIIQSPTPTEITGLEVLGWRDDTTADSAEYESGAIIRTNSSTFYAVYSHTITFYSGLNKESSSTTSRYYNSYGNMSNFTFPSTATEISGWELSGWTAYTYADGTGVSQPGATSLDTEFYSTYYASYARTLYFYGNDSGTLSDTRTQVYNSYGNISSVTTPTPTTVTNWTTDGWRDDTDNNVREYGYKTLINLAYDSATTFYAVYKKVVTVSYGYSNTLTDVSGTTADNSIYYGYINSRTFSLPVVNMQIIGTFTPSTNGFTRSGYIVTGWIDTYENTYATTGSTTVSIAWPIATPYHLIAQWSETSTASGTPGSTTTYATTGSCYDAIYTGSSQTLAGGGNYVTYSNNTGTSVGSYTVTVNANSGYTFIDGTSSKTLSCSISKATGYVNLTSSTGSVTVGTSATTFGFDSHAGSSAVATVTDDNSTANAYQSHAATITIDNLSNIAEGTNIIVTVTIPENENYTSASATYILTIGSPSSYVITYNANGCGTAPSSSTKTHGTALTLKNMTSVNTNYTMEGWSTSSSALSETWAPTGTYTTNESATLYAICASYGDVNQNGKVDPNDYLLVALHVDGEYTLTGQALRNADVDNNGVIEDRDQALIRAQYIGVVSGGLTETIEPITVTITYNANGYGTAPSSVTALIGDTITLPSMTSVNTNYVQEGWGASDDLNPEYTTNDQYIVYNSITLYAICASYGDVTMDGAINSSDVSYINQHIDELTGGVEFLSIAQQRNADVNNDDVIDETDTSLIQQYIDGTATGGFTTPIVAKVTATS